MQTLNVPKNRQHDIPLKTAKRLCCDSLTASRQMQNRASALHLALQAQSKFSGLGLST
jgi:hypothetical protein